MLSPLHPGYSQGDPWTSCHITWTTGSISGERVSQAHSRPTESECPGGSSVIEVRDTPCYTTLPSSWYSYFPPRIQAPSLWSYHAEKKDLDLGAPVQLEVPCWLGWDPKCCQTMAEFPKTAGHFVLTD